MLNKLFKKSRKLTKILAISFSVVIISVIGFMVVKSAATFKGDNFDDLTKTQEGDKVVMEEGRIILEDTQPKDVIYITTANHDGNLGGRAGADLFCADNKPSNLSVDCTNLHAFLSVSDTDEIRDMVDNYNYQGGHVYWWNNEKKMLVRLASSWADMLDGSIEFSQEVGTGISTNVWGGSYDDGRLSNHTCGGWSDSSLPGAVGYGAVTDSGWFNGSGGTWGTSLYYLRCLCEY